MRRRTFLGVTAALPYLSQAASAAPAAEETLAAIALPKPETSGGLPLMTALSRRKTSRNISDEKLPPQILSNLLWAAFGINRAGGRRTAPSAFNVQDIEIYVFLETGVYLFDAASHSLKPVRAGDHRGKTGGDAVVAKAPVGLVYVTNQDKFRGAGGGRLDDQVTLAWSHAHAGFIAQNVYLYAASQGLAAWFRASLDPAEIATLLNLKPSSKALYTQTVGRFAQA